MANVKDTQNIFSALLESRKNKVSAVKKVIESKTKKVESDETGFTGRLLRESLGEDVTDDIIDNITVVTDPDKTVQELEVRADAIQDAIDETPEGEAAFSDEYVGDTVYACPVCGESFFADEEYKDGDICPICKAEPQDGFLNQGVVAPMEPEVEEVPEDEVVEEPVEDETIEEVSEEPEAEKEEVAEESLKAESCTKKEGFNTSDYVTKILGAKSAEEAAQVIDDAKKAGAISDITAALQTVADDKFGKAVKLEGCKEAVEEDEDKVEVETDTVVIPESKCVCKECNEPEVQIEVDLNDNTVEISTPKTIDTEIDEKSFEDNLNQFADENYKGAIDDIKVVETAYDPVKDELCLDCVAECKNGKKANLSFALKESKIAKNKALLIGRETHNTFKIESKTPAFKFSVVNNDGVIKCESMRYSFITTHSKAGKVKVEGYCRTKR